MNIDGANISSLLPGSTATEGATPTSVASSGVPDGFTGAFIEQLKLLSADSSQRDGLSPMGSDASSTEMIQVQSMADVFGDGGAMQKLAAFFGKKLPVSYKIDESSDPQQLLSAFTDMLKFSGANAATTEGSQVEQFGRAEADTVVPAAVDGETGLGAQAFPAGLITATGADQQENSSTNDCGNCISAPFGDSAAALSALTAATTAQNSLSGDLAGSTSAATSIMPAIVPNINGRAANHSGVTEDSGAVLSEALEAADASQGNPVVNFEYLEKSDLAENNSQIDRDIAVGGDKSPLKAVAEMGPFNKQTVELRSEVPALTRPVTHPEWNKDLGERILWMNNRSITAAEIKLNPQHLGPLTIRVDVTQDQATISFAAQHSIVREALEASIPKLRDMMNAQQLNLIDVNVSQHFSSEQGRPQQQNFDRGAANPNLDAVEPVIETITELDNSQAVMTKGLLSLYA